MPNKTHSPSPCLCVDMGGMMDHTLVIGLQHSTMLDVLSPSLPPTTYSLLSITATPNCSLRPFMTPTWTQVSVRRSYFSMVVEPKTKKKSCFLKSIKNNYSRKVNKVYHIPRNKAAANIQIYRLSVKVIKCSLYSSYFSVAPEIRGVWSKQHDSAYCQQKN